MRSTVGACLAALVLSGCGGSDDRPDLEASRPTTETNVSTPVETVADRNESAATVPANAAPVPARQRGEIVSRARAAEGAIERWNRGLDACLGSAGEGAAAATCISSAWEQLFDQMRVAQFELLDLADRMDPGACHDALASVVDAVHGFLAGATPLEVVWLDEHQQPPSTFDLESIVDLARPVPARLRDAAATTCSS